MATYVDGFVFALPRKNIAAYKKMATLGRNIWRKHGALDYKECLLEDKQPKGVTLTFAKLAKAKPNETVGFAFIVYKSRAHRDKVNKLVMKDPAMNDPKYAKMPMPFDMKRMAFAGFTVIVDSK